MRFRTGQTVMLKKESPVKEEYRGKAGIVVAVQKHCLIVRFHKLCDTNVGRDEVAQILSNG